MSMMRILFTILFMMKLTIGAEMEMQKIQIKSMEMFSEVLAKKHLILVIKGSVDGPGDIHSSRLVKQVENLSFYYVNSFENAEIANQLKDKYDWPTLPLVFHNGDFVGGADIASFYINDEIIKNPTKTQKDISDRPFKDVDDKNLNSLEKQIKKGTN